MIKKNSSYTMDLEQIAFQLETLRKEVQSLEEETQRFVVNVSRVIFARLRRRLKKKSPQREPNPCNHTIEFNGNSCPS